MIPASLELNPSAMIQFSIPYVLLKASESFQNLTIATSENFRILKNGIMDIGKEYYFPEYELFKFYVEKTRSPFQIDGRHPSITLISEVSKHIVKEMGEEIMSKGQGELFSINRVNEKGSINGKCYLS